MKILLNLWLYIFNEKIILKFSWRKYCSLQSACEKCSFFFLVNNARNSIYHICTRIKYFNILFLLFLDFIWLHAPVLENAALIKIKFKGKPLKLNLKFIFEKFFFFFNINYVLMKCSTFNWGVKLKFCFKSGIINGFFSKQLTKLCNHESY